MKVNKLLSTILVTTVMITIIGGCATKEDSKTSSNEKEGTQVEANSSGKRIKIVLDVDTFQPDSPEFMHAYEDVTKMEKYANVDFELLPFDADYRTTLPIAISSGEQRDILCVRAKDWLKEWAQLGIIIPVDEYAAKANVDYDKTYGDAALDCRVGDQTYGIPNAVNQYALYYNKKIFDDAGIPYPDPKIPMTWEEYDELSKKLTSGEGENKIYGALEVDWPIYWYGSATMELGGTTKGFYTEDGEASNIENPAFAKALERKMKRMYEYKSVPTYADIVSSKTGVNSFLNGKYGMCAQGPWTLDWLSDLKTYPRDWKAGMAPMPVPSGTKMKTYGSVNYLTISKTSVNPQLAYEIAKDIEDTMCQYASTPNANKLLEQPKLFIKAGEALAQDGITTELIKGIYANPESRRYDEKIAGKASTEYLKIITEETELLFSQEQSIEDTISHIKKRADEAIAAAK